MHNRWANIRSKSLFAEERFEKKCRTEKDKKRARVRLLKMGRRVGEK